MTKSPNKEQKKIYLKDYSPSPFSLPHTQLHFSIVNESQVVVTSNLSFERSSGVANAPLVLNGEGLKLLSVTLNNQEVRHEVTSTHLTLFDLPQAGQLQVKVELNPLSNTALSGLYKSGNNLLTQCEAEGFRRITYFLDRPDVLSKFDVTIEASRLQFPHLLANGNLIAESALLGDRHQVSWQDPFNKPCYLFALVAGDFEVLTDSQKTRSGRNVKLEIYTEKNSSQKCLHAMESLKKSMLWDEERFGLEYDLDRYMIVATHDFNMGAMENKGLNIFNTKYVFADSKTATDYDYFGVESVVAHEYFHNWTGNRVTVRDWFHLSLKEGLTVFRDQEFSMDQSSQALVRIDSVERLKSSQFAEDAGPSAHPIRPESGYAVDNFYTSTIYEKGAEVIRMMQTIVGRPGFTKGMKLYIDRFDGKAVIIEDFAESIAEANNVDFSQFKLWYSQAGTPQVQVQEAFHNGNYTLTLTQSCELTAQEKEVELAKKPFVIPLVVGWLDQSGVEIQLSHPRLQTNTEGQTLIILNEKSLELQFSGLREKPVLSLNRTFSSPIQLNRTPNASEQFLLARFDTDPYNRYSVMQELFEQELSRLYLDSSATVNINLLNLVQEILHSKIDSGLKAKLISLPAKSYFVLKLNHIDVESIKQAYDKIESKLASHCETVLFNIYRELHGKNITSRDPKTFAERRLKNSCLAYLSLLPQQQNLVWNQFSEAQIMTDEQSAFALCLEIDAFREKATQQFFEKWKDEALVVNKWLTLQARSEGKHTFNTVKKLWEHQSFNVKNPNNVYALLYGFVSNLVQSHQPNTEIYEFISSKIIELDRINPQVACRHVEFFDFWNKLPELQKNYAHQELLKLKDAKLSPNTYEFVENALKLN